MVNLNALSAMEYSKTCPGRTPSTMHAQVSSDDRVATQQRTKYTKNVLLRRKCAMSVQDGFNN